MTFAALTNWQYDKSLYHRIQSGPQHTGSNLNLLIRIYSPRVGISGKKANNRRLLP